MGLDPFSWAMIISSAAKVGGDIYGAKKSASASDRATQRELEAQRLALEAEERSEREARRVLEEKQRRDREADEPYRIMRERALQEMAALLGLPPGFPSNWGMSGDGGPG